MTPVIYNDVLAAVSLVAAAPPELQAKFDGLERTRKHQDRLQKKAEAREGGGAKGKAAEGVTEPEQGAEEGRAGEGKKRAASADEAGRASGAAAKEAPAGGVPQWRLERDARKKSKKQQSASS